METYVQDKSSKAIEQFWIIVYPTMFIRWKFPFEQTFSTTDREVFQMLEDVASLNTAG